MEHVLRRGIKLQVIAIIPNMQILPVLNSQYYYYQVGEEHEYYLPMLILIVASIVLQVNNIQQTLIYPHFGHNIANIGIKNSS